MSAICLAESVERLLDLDYLDSLQLGQAIRVLIDIHQPKKREIQAITHLIVKKLRDTAVLSDSEFYEGLN